jgi:hypothetical protein
MVQHSPVAVNYKRPQDTLHEHGTSNLKICVNLWVDIEKVGLTGWVLILVRVAWISDCKAGSSLEPDWQKNLPIHDEITTRDIYYRFKHQRERDLA